MKLTAYGDCNETNQYLCSLVYYKDNYRKSTYHHTLCNMCPSLTEVKTEENIRCLCQDRNIPWMVDQSVVWINDLVAIKNRMFLSLHN